MPIKASRRLRCAARLSIALVSGISLPSLADAQLRGPVAGPAAAVTPMPRAELAALVDGITIDAMDSQHVAGVTVSVVQGGQVAFLKGYGIAGVEPVRAVDAATTGFRIGSVSKTLTWILLMRLVEQGRVDLDAPVNRYLPADLQIPDDGVQTPIRVRDLPGHTSGFEDHWLGTIVAEDPASIPSPAEFLRLNRPRRVREPGLFPTYSNYGANLAGAIITQVEGADLPSIADRAIFGPLGMTHTTFRERYPAVASLPAPMPAELATLQAEGLVWSGGSYRPGRAEYFSMTAAAGSATTTAADMARYMLMQLRGGELGGIRVYGPQAAQAFRKPLVATPSGVNGWAHGFMVLALPGGYTGYGHDGASLYQNASMIVVPALDLGVFVATNTASGGALAARLPRKIIEHFYAQPTLLRQHDPTLDARAARYEGAYLSTRRAYGGLELFEELLSDSMLTVSVSGGYLRTEIDGAWQAWVPDRTPGRFRGALSDDVLAFDLDAAGRATGFETQRGTSRMERTGFWLDPRTFERLGRAALLAAASLLIGGLARLRRAAYGHPESRRMDVLAVAAALLWLAGFAVVGRWIATMDEMRMAYAFPDAWLLGGALLTIAAVGTTAVVAVLTPLAWLRGRDFGRMAVVVQAAAVSVLLLFAGVLAVRGLLSPWS